MAWAAVDLGYDGIATLAVAFAASPTGSTIVGSTDFAGDGIPIAFSWTAGTYSNLGNIPGGSDPFPTSVANGLSADTTVIVGNSSGGAAGGPYSGSFYNGEAFSYSSGVMSGLGFLAAGDGSNAWAVSGDNLTIVGTSQVIAGPAISTPTFPCIWVSGSISALSLFGGATGGSALAVSDDGSVVVGFVTDAFGNDIPAVWVSGVISAIPFPGSETIGHARCVSADGTIIGGDVGDGITQHAFIFTGGVTTLIGDPFLQTSSIANGISGDGLTLVGQGFGSSGTPGLAWLWTLADGFIDLPRIGGDASCSCLGISADGSRPVGLSAFPARAVYWQSVGGELVVAFDGLIRKTLVSIGSFACGPIPLFPTLPVGFPVKLSINMDTTIGTTKSLREVRVAQRLYPLWDIELPFQELRDETQNIVPYAPLIGFTQYQELVQLWLSMYGQTGVFAFDAPWDNSRAEQPIGAGDDVTTSFVIYRVWGLGSEAVVAPIGMINEVFEVTIDDVPVPSTDYAVDRNRIFFTTAPAAGLEIKMTFSYYYLCKFMEDEQDFEEFAKDRWTVSSLKFQSIYWP